MAYFQFIAKAIPMSAMLFSFAAAATDNFPRQYLPMWKATFSKDKHFYCDSQRTEAAKDVYFHSTADSIDGGKLRIWRGEAHTINCGNLYDYKGNLVKSIQLHGATDPEIPEKSMSGKVIVKTVEPILTPTEEAEKLSLENSYGLARIDRNDTEETRIFRILYGKYYPKENRQRAQSPTDEYTIKFDADVVLDWGRDHDGIGGVIKPFLQRNGASQ